MIRTNLRAMKVCLYWTNYVWELHLYFNTWYNITNLNWYFPFAVIAAATLQCFEKQTNKRKKYKFDVYITLSHNSIKFILIIAAVVDHHTDSKFVLCDAYYRALSNQVHFSFLKTSYVYDEFESKNDAKKRHNCRAAKQDRTHWLNCFMCDDRDPCVLCGAMSFFLYSPWVFFFFFFIRLLILKWNVILQLIWIGTMGRCYFSFLFSPHLKLIVHSRNTNTHTHTFTFTVVSAL